MFLLLFAIAVVGGALLLAAGARRLRNDTGSAGWNVAEATVVGHGQARFPALPARWRDRLRAPRVAWTTADGTRHEAACLGSLNGRDTLRGRVVRIRVDPRDGTRVRLEGQAATPPLVAGLLIAGGAMTLLFGLAGLALAIAFR